VALASGERAIATALIAALTQPDARDVWRATGFEPA